MFCNFNMEMTQNAAQKRKEKVALLRDAVGTKGEPTAATEIDDQDAMTIIRIIMMVINIIPTRSFTLRKEKSSGQF